MRISNNICKKIFSLRGEHLCVRLLIFLIITAILILLLFIYGSKTNYEDINIVNNNFHSAQPNNLDFYETAFEFKKKEIDLDDKQVVVGGIIPHHLLAADMIAEFFSNFSNINYDTVILLGPNHFSAGEADIITSAYDWQTPYGVLECDKDVLDKIKEFNVIEIEEKVFREEHSINSEVAFIKRTFPQAKFLPLVLKDNINQAQAEGLGNFLFEAVKNESVLILASIDFSHYKDSITAQEDDKESIKVIKNFAFNDVYNIDVDSSSSLYTLLIISKNQNTQFKLLNNSNSAILADKPDLKSTTSYVTGYFIKSNNKKKPITFLFFGDIMLDRYVKEKIERQGFDYLFQKWQLPDEWQQLDIQMANLEGAVTKDGVYYLPNIIYDFAFGPESIQELKNYNFNFFSIANNHILDQGQRGFSETQQNLDELGFNYVGCPDKKVDECSVKITEVQGRKVAMLAYSMVYGALDEKKIMEQIESTKNNSDLVIANMHWGVEYEHQVNIKQRDIAHKMIDAGVDLIIGHHPHVVQEVEIYKDRAIFYSLGNFIFDQYFSQATQEGLAVGVNWMDDNIELHLFPLKSKSSQPELMRGDEKKKFLGWLGNLSNNAKGYEEQIKNGKIILEK